MKTKQLVLGILISATLTTFVPAQEKNMPSPEVRVMEELVSITAKVLSVDIATRELTLKGPMGDVVTLVVDNQVKRLNEIRHGDAVTAKYYLGTAAELRPPSAEEQRQPFVILKAKEPATSGTSPGAGAARVVRVVATVEALDRMTQTATIRGPRGYYLTVRVKDPRVLEKPRLGDTVVVTCAEALAVSVEKLKARE